LDNNHIDDKKFTKVHSILFVIQGPATFHDCECFQTTYTINILVGMRRTILFLSVLFMACNSGTSTSDNSLAQDKRIAASERRKFLRLAAEGSMMELAAGRFASGHATDQRLKNYGYEMIKNHEHFLEQIKSMALLHNIALPDTVSNKHKQLLQVLSVKAGNSFDSIYMAEIISHQKDLSHVYEEIKTSPDTALASYAARSMPVITSNLLRLITLRDSIYIRRDDIQ
jgi:predicted outer membrane protein